MAWRDMRKISFEQLKDLKKSSSGLTSVEVVSQRKKYGENKIVEVSGHPFLELFADTFKDPMIWFLISIGSLFFALGNQSEAITLFVAIVPLVGMDAFLHWRTQASTSGLKGQLASRVHVLRVGKEVEVDSTALVPGDLILVTSGFFLPADGVFEDVDGLQVDESALTGESFPILKSSIDIDPFSLSERGEISVDPKTLGFAGTRVLTGTGTFRVLATGTRTAYGEIVQSVSSMPHERTPLQQSITRLVRGLIFAAGAFCILLAGVRIYQGHGWLDALLSAATLAIAAIPEEFPVVFTFFLGVGVYRLAKRQALVRRAVSVENIGRITYICTDKTGTITEGKLTLTHLDPEEGTLENEVLKVGLCASNPEGSDPMDQAIQNLSKERNLIALERIRDFPFTEDRKRETAIVAEDELLFAYMKGSPETVLRLSEMTESQKTVWDEKISKWASEGHKVIACARRKLTKEESDNMSEPGGGFEFCGLMAFEDPPRPEVAEAITYSKKNGIHVLMITGDHPKTAQAIAKDVGLGGASPAVCSAEEESEKFTATWLRLHPEFLKKLDVVARCTPIEKMRIVQALKGYGELVAVTGDGVNDVPALKAADIGIAMGRRGTRSAKEVSSMILSDDNFSTIVNAIREGGQLFSNLRMSFEYLLLFHIPFVLTAALVPLFGYPLLYLPIHIVWLELIIHPTALFAFQQEASLKEERPRTQVGFFSKRGVFRILSVGFILTGALAYLFHQDIESALSIERARAKSMALLTLWSAILVVHFTRLTNRSSIAIFLGTILSTLLALQSSFLSKWLHVSSIDLKDSLVVLGIIFGSWGLLWLLRERS